MSFNIASGLFCETFYQVVFFLCFAIQDEREGPINAELLGKVGSNLLIPPEERKLKDDDSVDIQVSYIALILNNMPFQTTRQQTP